MCGRYTLVDGTKVLNAFPNLRVLSDETEHFLTTPHYNIAPGQKSAVIFITEAMPSCDLMRWGFIPPWVKEQTTTYKMINARSEDVDKKPAYRRAFRHTRCLVPSDGFYEWKKRYGKGRKPPKIPVYIHHRENDLLMMAGLYSMWISPEGDTLLTYTILTTEPNELIRPIHNRMPVILPREHWSEWLDPSVHDVNRLKALLRPYPSEALEAYPVSTRVNSPVHDDPTCIQPMGLF